MPITEDELRGVKAPFKVRADNDGTVGTVIGFSDNDPLGVGGGMLPDMPTAHFSGGGWCLIQDLMNHQSLIAK